MSKSNKEKNSIIITFSFFLLLTLVLTFLIIFKIIPWIIEVENLKKSALETYNTIKQKEISWITYEEFEAAKANIPSLNSNDLYLTEVLRTVDKEFFEKNLSNTWTWTYNDFMIELNKKYSDTSSFEEKMNLISNILPVYAEWISDLEWSYLSDFKFINYIESLAETFNVSFPNSIWISELELVNNYAVSVWDTSLEKNIFYIPLTLDISWTKESIISFLYYVQKVWNISISWEDIVVDSNIDKEFQEFKTRVLKWQEKTKDYNIFNNHIFDIESIVFEEYIDSSFDILDSTNQDFISYIKTAQWSDKYLAKAKFRFYVKGIPMFEIEWYIKDFISDFNKLNSEVLSNLWKQDTPQTVKLKLQEYKTTLDQLNTSVVVNLQKSIWTKTDIERSFMDVNRYKWLIKEYSDYLESLKQ